MTGKQAAIAVLLALAMVTVAVPAQADHGPTAPNGEQTGKTDPACLTVNHLTAPVSNNVIDTPTVQWAKQFSPVWTVDVEPGTVFEIWADDDSDVFWINFYSAQGKHLDLIKDDGLSNVVPDDAAYAIFCLTDDIVFGWNRPATPTAHYQDGWAPGSSDAPNKA